MAAGYAAWQRNERRRIVTKTNNNNIIINCESSENGKEVGECRPKKRPQFILQSVNNLTLFP